MTKSSLETVTLFDIRSSLMHFACIGVAPLSCLRGRNSNVGKMDQTWSTYYLCSSSYCKTLVTLSKMSRSTIHSGFLAKEYIQLLAYTI